MNPLDRPLTVTLFTDKTASTATALRTSLRDLAARIRDTDAPVKDALPWLKLATFGESRTVKGSLRNNANVQAVDGIEGDNDGGAVTVDQACAALSAAGIAAVVYTSPSHQEHAPRWRVLAPLSDAAAPEGRREHVARLNHVLGGVLANESFTLSQAYYLGSVGKNPAHTVRLIEGRALDLATEIPGLGPVKVKAPVVPVIRASAADGGDRPAAALAAACAMFEEQPEAGRHNVLRTATLSVAPYVLSGHLARPDVIADMASAMAESGREPNDSEVESALDGALRRSRPWEPPVAAADEFPAADAEVSAGSVAPPRIAEPTEDAAALSFSEHHGGDFAYDCDDKRWYYFCSGIGWERDDTGVVTRAVRTHVRAVRRYWGNDKESAPMAKIGFMTNVERACQSESCFAVTRAVWDADPFVLACRAVQSTCEPARGSPPRASKRCCAALP